MSSAEKPPSASKARAGSPAGEAPDTEKHHITEARATRFREVIANRQAGLLIAMENVTDPHNIMAVLRTADSVGVQRILALQTYAPYGRHAVPSAAAAPAPPPLDKTELPDPETQEWATVPIEAPRRRARKGLGVANLGARSSSGSVKWVDLEVYKERDVFLAAIRQSLGPEGRLIGLTAQDDGEPPCTDLYAADLRGPLALALGNERDGLSPELLSACQARISIPQLGMARSLNVSVAAAVVLYEALRQRRYAGQAQHPAMPAEAQQALFRRWHDRELAKRRGTDR